MGVFKWLRRERVTVTTRQVSPSAQVEQPPDITQVGTIRTEEYKRDLAEFQARRSSASKDIPTTPDRRKCGRHSLPVSCTDCTRDPDSTFNYEKKSATKYKKKIHKVKRRSSTEEKVPNIQFLFQNQVFMPGNMFSSSYSEPAKSRRHSHRPPDMDFLVQRHIDFKEDQLIPPPLFFKNNSLSFDVKNFLDTPRSDDVDGLKGEENVKSSSHNSPVDLKKDDSCEDKMWEVMGELKDFDQWADEQLKAQSINTTKSDDNKSDASVYGLPITSSSDLSVTLDNTRTWIKGKWGVVPVQIKKIVGVTIEQVKKKRNTEINILRKCRHPNIILLMGLYPDVYNDVYIICERSVDSLYGVLHVKGRIISAQTSVRYALDIANALVFLRMQGYLHTQLSSSSIMITSQDTAKLADVGPCAKLMPRKQKEKFYEEYSPEPQYINIQEANNSNPTEKQALLSETISEAYLSANAIAKEYASYHDSELYRWQAPELFEPDAHGLVYPCSRTDVYSLCLILWECCNAAIPWKTLKYEKLKEVYLTWKTGIRLPQDGTYPGGLLALLQDGLMLQRKNRPDLNTLQATLQTVKCNLDDMEYIIIPARLSKTKSNFSTQAWDTTSPTDSECQSPKQIKHKAVIHKRDSSTDSDKEVSRSVASPMYETIPKTVETCSMPDRCFIYDDDGTVENIRPVLRYEHLPEKDFSSACSTPIAKLHARIRENTPLLHKSDSTEYCSILSPDPRGLSLALNDVSIKDKSERSATKLSRSFTPQSYKPLHINVPEFNLDSIKSIVKDNGSSERSTYNFDIKNYSLPSTPIARSNKLRKNAWLSGDVSDKDRSTENIKFLDKTSVKEATKKQSETRATSANTSMENEADSESSSKQLSTQTSVESEDTARNSFTGLRRVDPPHDFVTYSESNEIIPRDRTGSWSFKSSRDSTSTKYKVEEEVLANVNVKPLVAIHERWIYEANRKTGRSMSLPEEGNLKSQCLAVKPASHCVDTLQKSLPQLNLKRANMGKIFRAQPISPGSGKNGNQWDQFCQARDTISRSVNFALDSVGTSTWKKDNSKGTSSIADTHKVDQSTDTLSIEEFIRDLIRKEFQHLLHEISDDASTTTSVRKEEILNKGVSNILESLKTSDEPEPTKRESIKSFSRLKINGNNKPLLQITFGRSGENSLKVLDNCVNVTFCDGGSVAKENAQSEEDTLTPDDIQVNSLKRCQAFNAIQEARSTEDLYIDDDLSTHMQENFGGKVKLIPLHGSLHEILCEKEDDCCLIKVKQENGCDTIYFRCDNSDTESRDAIDGAVEGRPQDTVVFKRSISLIEERIQRVIPKEKRPIIIKKKPDIKSRPKSEIFLPKITKESRVMSSSSPSLITKDGKSEEVEVNIENVMCYQDSSSDECLKCSDIDDFELIEREIEEDIANSNLTSLNCGCLEKISEENLSIINEEVTEKN